MPSAYISNEQFLIGLIDEGMNGLSQTSKAVDYFGDRQLQLDKTNMQLRLQQDTDEFMLGLEEVDPNNYEEYESRVNEFIESKKNALQDKNSPYYTRNQYTAEAFKPILESHNQQLRTNVLRQAWSKKVSFEREKLSQNLQYIMNKPTVRGGTDELTGENIQSYSYADRQNDAMNLIYTAQKAGYISNEDAERYAGNLYSENLQATEQEALKMIWEDNPKLTKSQAQAKAREAVKAGQYTNTKGETISFDVRNMGTYTAYKNSREREEAYTADYENYNAEMRAYQRALSHGETMIEPTAPSKPTTREEHKANYAANTARLENESDEAYSARIEKYNADHAEEYEASRDYFDTIDNAKAIENGGIIAIKAIEQAQREQNARRINQNEEITTAYYKALTKEGGMKEGDFRDLSNQIDRQIKVLEAETNYSMDANDKRARIRELYLLKKGLQEGKAYNSARAGGGGQKEKSMSYPTFANQKIDFALRAVDDGTMSAQQAYTFTRDITFNAAMNNAAMNNAGEIGETFSYNGKEFANLTDEEKLTVWQETTDTGLVSRIIDETTKALRKNTEFAPLFAKFDKLNAAIKKDPDKYSPEALARLGEVMNSILWTAKGDGSEDKTALCNQLQQAYDGFYLNEAENRLVPKLDGKGNIEMPNINFDATSASAKEVGEVIKLLEDNGAYTYTNPQNNKQMFVTPQTEERIKNYDVDLKDIIAANLNVDSDSLTPITHYKDGKPDLIPQFRGDDGKIYELRSVTNDKGNATGFEIYDVTGGKEERIDFKFTTPRQRNKQKQHDAQEATNAIHNAEMDKKNKSVVDMLMNPNTSIQMLEMYGLTRIEGKIYQGGKELSEDDIFNIVKQRASSLYK